MTSKKIYYQNKTKIPDFLKPLPKINNVLALKYRIPNIEPFSLVTISCQALMKLDISENSMKIWKDFVEIFQNNSRIVPDSYKRLCRIDDPVSSAAFIISKAKEKGMELENYLNFIKLIDSVNKQQNHWQMSSSAKKFPLILIADVYKYKYLAQT